MNTEIFTFRSGINRLVTPRLPKNDGLSYSHPVSESEAGESIDGRYRLEKAIGQGGTGCIYCGWDDTAKRRVTIKRISNLGQFLPHIPELPQWSHPNLISYYEAGRDENGIWIAGEYYEGRDLAQIVSLGPIEPAELLPLFTDCLQGCQEAHDSGFIHGDLGPANLLLTQVDDGTMQWKLIDFDFFAEGRSQLFGSIYVIAPELFDRRHKTVHSDLYALGCSFYFAATGGTYPFTGESTQEVMLDHLRGEPIPLRRVVPAITPELSDWIMRLIARDPQDRPASAVEALEALAHIPINY